jgi:histidinol-phosphate aminotransferase
MFFTMKFSQLANPRILEQPTYQPGRPIEDVAKEQGIDPGDICKLASNENPWGTSKAAREAARDALDDVHRYPDGSSLALREKLAKHHKLSPDQFIIGNGSNEIIELIGHVFLSEEDEVLFGEYAFIVYRLVSLLMGAKPVCAPMPGLRHDLQQMKKLITERTKLVFLPSPNNPTGTSNTEDEIFSFVRDLPDQVIFCLDEAYAEYLEHSPDLRTLLQEGKKVMGLRTFSKIYGLAGLRIGYGYGSVELIKLLQQARQPFNANAIALAAATAALDDQAWVQECRHKNNAGMQQLQDACDQLNLPWIPSDANFLLVEIGDGQKAFHALQALGVIARPMPKGLEQYIRISVGTTQENEIAISAIKKVLQILKNPA